MEFCTGNAMPVIKYVINFDYILITPLVTHRKSRLEVSNRLATVSVRRYRIDMKPVERRMDAGALLSVLSLLVWPTRWKTIRFGGAKILKPNFIKTFVSGINFKHIYGSS